VGYQDLISLLKGVDKPPFPSFWDPNCCTKTTLYYVRGGAWGGIPGQSWPTSLIVQKHSVLFYM